MTKKEKEPATKRTRDSSPSKDEEETLHRRVKRLEDEVKEQAMAIQQRDAIIVDLDAKVKDLQASASSVPSTEYPVPQYTAAPLDAEASSAFEDCFELPEGSLVFEAARECFFVRKEYSVLHKVLREVHSKEYFGDRCVLIAGNPGIGKTIALEDLLRRELADGKKPFDHIMCVAQLGIMHFVREGKTWAARKYLWASVLAIGSLFHALKGATPSLLLLHDIKSTTSCMTFQGVLVANLLNSLRVTAVFASSPDAANTKDLEKVFPGLTPFYSDCWTRDECRVVFRQLHPESDDAAFEAQYYVTGGIARFLGTDVEHVKEDLKNGIADLKSAESMSYHHNYCGVGMAVSCENHRRLSRVEFVSGYAKDLWAEKSGRSKGRGSH